MRTGSVYIHQGGGSPNNLKGVGKCKWTIVLGKPTGLERR